MIIVKTPDDARRMLILACLTRVVVCSPKNFKCKRCGLCCYIFDVEEIGKKKDTICQYLYRDSKGKLACKLQGKKKPKVCRNYASVINDRKGECYLYLIGKHLAESIYKDM